MNRRRTTAAYRPRRGRRASGPGWRQDQPGAGPWRRKQPKLGLGFSILLVSWFVTTFDPHYFLAAKGFPSVVIKISPILLLTLGAIVAVGVPSKPAWSRRWTWHLPLLAFIGLGAASLPFVSDFGLARLWVKAWGLSWLLVVATVTLVNSVRRAELLMVVYGASFIWFAAWGAPHGQVLWHTHLFLNPDGFGALAAIGFAFLAYMTMAHPNKWARRGFMAGAALCLMGVVASFARGAFLATVLVLGVMWLRSPNKLKAAGAVIGGSLVLAATAAVMYGDTFWHEIQSAFSQGTTEGTGEDRWVLWTAAWEVFLENPIFGTGPGNWGVYGSTMFSVGELGSRYAEPSRLYYRSLHNLYITTLSELGVTGSAAFIWILVDFWKRNVKLRSRAAMKRWRALGGTMDLKSMALALELAMIAFLSIAVVYSTAGKHWFFTIQALNLVLYHWTFKERPRRVRARRSDDPPRGRRNPVRRGLASR